MTPEEIKQSLQELEEGHQSNLRSHWIQSSYIQSQCSHPERKCADGGCEHDFEIPTIFEVPPNGGEGAWCSASICEKCCIMMVFNFGLGKFKEYRSENTV